MFEIFSAFDWSVLNWIHDHMRCGFLDALMPFVSALGNDGRIWIAAAAILLCFRAYRAAGIAMLVALLLGFLIGNLTLKPLIARIRPGDINTAVALLIPRPTDYAFPSGHTLSSFAAATALFRRHKRLGGAGYALGALIAFSRLYLYVHYPTDIIGGMVLGVGCGIAAIRGLVPRPRIARQKNGWYNNKRKAVIRCQARKGTHGRKRSP